MHIRALQLRFILSRIGKNPEIKKLTMNSDIFDKYLDNSLWNNIANTSVTRDYVYRVQIGSLMVCFPEYISFIENSDLSDLCSYSIALCYLFPERVLNASLLDALTPIQKDYKDMLKDVMVEFNNKLYKLSGEYLPKDYKLSHCLTGYSFLIDSGALSENDLKRCLDVIFHNFTFN